MTDLMTTQPTNVPALLVDTVRKAEEYASHARAKNTNRAYRADWNDWNDWATAHNLEPLPAAPQAVGLYLADRASSRKTSTLRRRLSAISQAHKLAGHHLDTRHPAISEVWNGICRSNTVATDKKTPVMTDTVRRMLATTATDSLIGARDRAIILLGFGGCMRRSEIVALDVTDVAFVTEGMTITVRRSKTDQRGEGLVKGIPFGAHPATCPVRALQAWLTASNITEGAIFRTINRHGQIGARLSGEGVAIVVKRACAAAGLDPALYAGHSLRSGHATAAAANGVGLLEIMDQGAWRSERVARGYIRTGSLFLRNSASKLGL